MYKQRKSYNSKTYSCTVLLCVIVIVTHSTCTIKDCPHIARHHFSCGITIHRFEIQTILKPTGHFWNTKTCLKAICKLDCFKAMIAMVDTFKVICYCMLNHFNAHWPKQSVSMLLLLMITDRPKQSINALERLWSHRCTLESFCQMPLEPLCLFVYHLLGIVWTKSFKGFI